MEHGKLVSDCDFIFVQQILQTACNHWLYLDGSNEISEYYTTDVATFIIIPSFTPELTSCEPNWFETFSHYSQTSLNWLFTNKTFIVLTRKRLWTTSKPFHEVVRSN